MREFNYDEAKAGQEVCTRSGLKARVICWDAKGNFPIIALVEKEESGIFYEDSYSFDLNGDYNPSLGEAWADLMMKD